MHDSVLSTEISRNLTDVSAGPFAMLCGSMKKETLQDWVNRKLRETGFSHAKVSERAKRQGHKISAGYINNLAQGDADNPSAKLMKGIAAGFGVPVEEVIAVVFGEPLADDRAFQKSDFAALAQAYESLPPDIQRQKRPLLEMLIREINREV